MSVQPIPIDPTTVPDALGEPPEVLRGYYRQMALIRAFELRAAQMYQRAKIGGYCHLNLGEEATVVGLMAALRATDYLFTTYREHGYALCPGLEPGRVMAELFGKATGVSGGRGGSMHLFDTTVRLLGGYGIVGGQIPPATGAALALTYRGAPGPDAEAVMCLLGDGTTNIGAFHESLNLAALWRLPIVYVIVNNGLGMGTAGGEGRRRTRTVQARLLLPDPRRAGGRQRRGRGARAARAVLARARTERQPGLIEAVSQPAAWAFGGRPGQVPVPRGDRAATSASTPFRRSVPAAERRRTGRDGGAAIDEQAEGRSTRASRSPTPAPSRRQAAVRLRLCHGYPTRHTSFPATCGVPGRGEQ